LAARIRCRQLLVPWRNTSSSTRITNNSLIGSIIPADSNVVALLRKAGAVLLGKANLSEWADARSSSYSEGYSARGGQTRPPYNLTQEPGGSSSGPAVSVAANMVPFALGTETDGSVISPADRNAVVGLKPTVGLTARTGVIPESHRQDSVGVFGKTVKDAAYALDGCFGPDPADNYSMAQIGKTPSSISHNLTVLIIDYSQFVKGKSALQGVKLAVPWQRLWTAPSTQDQLPQLLAAIEALQAAGAIIYNNTNPPFINDTISPDGWSSNYGANASLTTPHAELSKISSISTTTTPDLKVVFPEPSPLLHQVKMVSFQLKQQWVKSTLPTGMLSTTSPTPPDPWVSITSSTIPSTALPFKWMDTLFPQTTLVPVSNWQLE